MREFEISTREAGQRMDKYLLRMLSEASPGFVYKMLRKKNIVLNGKKAAGSEILREGDAVRLYLSDETFGKFAPAFSEKDEDDVGGTKSEVPGIEIVYEDEDIVIVNKPSGLLSQKARPGDDSANDRIIAYLLRSGQITEEELRTFHPSVCNRLDRNTSGLLIAGKTMRGLQEMSELLHSRELKKYYHALVAGRVEEEAHLRGRLIKDRRRNTVRILDEECEDPSAQDRCGTDDGSGKRSKTDLAGDFVETAYRPIEYYGDATLLDVYLITGRSHQIRAHLASVGHPILGDAKYGDASLNLSLRHAAGISSQLLCACRMEFPDGRVVEIRDPDPFERAERFLRA